MAEVQHSAQEKPMTFRNPTCTPKTIFGDPMILRDPVSGLYYLYSTAHWGIGLHESRGLIDWRPAGHSGPHKWLHDQKYERENLGAKFFWAPHVLCREEDGGPQYYVFFCSAAHHTDGIDKIRLRVAKSSRPDKDFKWWADIEEHRTFIDPFVLQISNGSWIIYAATLADWDVPSQDKPAGIWAAQLSHDFKKIEEDWRFLFGPLTHPEKWVTEPVNEAPWVTELDENRYVLQYSANLFSNGNYGIGYAVSTTGPFGPFQKALCNPILRGNDKVRSPGHHCVVEEGRSWWAVYHVDNPNDKPARRLFMDRMYIDEDTMGVKITGPTLEAQQLP